MNKFKILLIAIYSRTMNVMFEELGIEYIAVYMRSHGYEVVLMSEKDNQLDYDEIKRINLDIIDFSVYDVLIEAVCNASQRIKQILTEVQSVLEALRRLVME